MGCGEGHPRGPAEEKPRLDLTAALAASGDHKSGNRYLDDQVLDRSDEVAPNRPAKNVLGQYVTGAEQSLTCPSKCRPRTVDSWSLEDSVIVLVRPSTQSLDLSLGSPCDPSPLPVVIGTALAMTCRRRVLQTASI